MSRVAAFRTGMPLVAIAGISLWLLLFWRGPLINDVAWQIWIAERLNAGDQLYVDVLEVNPPLWFWLGAKVEALSGELGMGALEVLLLLFAVAALVATATALALAKSRVEQVAVTVGLVVFLLISSPYALGQREQFAFLAVAPLVLLAGRRAEREGVSPWLAFAVGALAAPGLLLKPYFLLVPIALEVWLTTRLGRFQLRPELLALGTAGLIYAVSLLLFAPAYLTTMLPLIRRAYSGYDSDLPGLLLGPDVVAPTLLLAGCLVASRGDRPASLGAALVAGAAFLVAGLWQFKGFAYHFLPALGCALVALILSLRTLMQARGPTKVCVLAGLALVGATLVRESARNDGAAVVATAGLPRGSTVLMLSESASAAWPLVGERAFVWPSRHMAHWMLAAVWLTKAEGRADPEMERLGREIVIETAADIERSRPVMLLFDRRYDQASGGVVEFFQAEPAFAAAMQAYQREPDVGYLAIYRRR